MRFDDLNPDDDAYASRVVDRVFDEALRSSASDIHIEKVGSRVMIRLRVHGNLVEIGSCPDGNLATILGRIKGLARLVTYRHDVPQEGRMYLQQSNLEARVGTLPTLHGERAVIRLANRQTLEWLPTQLGLNSATLTRLTECLNGPSGVLLISGPAGCGKTTTAYACMRYLSRSDARKRSLVSLEDPIESELRDVSQSQINPAAGYDWSLGLKALLRQDPEVLMVGEIRDAETAAVVFQAAMTGQLVITTLHARSAADALRRLMDLGVPMHHLCSGLAFLICQRLVRQNCVTCADSRDPRPRCETCGGTGYAGRRLLSELLPEIEGELAQAIARDAGSNELHLAAQSQGMLSLVKLGDAAAER